MDFIVPIVAPLVSHLFKNGSQTDALYIHGRREPAFLASVTYYTSVNNRCIPFDPFAMQDPVGDIYSHSSGFVMSKNDYIRLVNHFDVGFYYEPRLVMLIEGVIESCLRYYSPWSIDFTSHRHIVNVMDDSCLAAISGVGEQYMNTIHEMRNAFTAKCNDLVSEMMAQGTPITYEMAEKRLAFWWQREHDDLLRNYIYSKEVDEYLDALNWRLFGVISSSIPGIFAIHDSEAGNPEGGWRVLTCETTGKIVTICDNGDYRVLDWRETNESV